MAVLAVLGLVAGLFAGVHLLTSSWGRPPAAAAGKPVPVDAVQGHRLRIPPMKTAHRPPVAWPRADSGTAVVAASVRPAKRSGSPALATPGSVRAGQLPVWIGPSVTSPGQPGRGAVTSAYRATPAARVQVSMAPQSAAAALGLRGVVFSVGQAAAGAAAGRVHVSLDYSSFAAAYGGDYASRLHLVELPACALTTPQVPGCRTATSLRAGAADSVYARRVGADVTLPGTSTAAALAPGTTVLTSAVSPSAGSSPAVVLAALAAPTGSGGSYTVPALSDATEWVTSGSAGAFTYSYPITVPPVPGNLSPPVSLSYDSQTTDGLTSATNNEASWVGDGWDYIPGFIEQDFATCSSLGGLTNPHTADLCASPSGQPMTVSFNGSTSPMVSGGSNGFHSEADQGAKFQQVTASGQTYWKMTQPDGMQYYFGLNHLTGWASGNPATNSAWSVPVASGSTFTTKVWRWNLDYAVDPHGDAVAYFYSPQTNYYAENNGTTGSAAYTQGGVLTKIEYGVRDGSVYTSTPAAQVNFTVSTTRQDAPDDLACSSGAACSVKSPTFWTDDTLTGISTQALVGGSLQNVDSWALNGTYPATGDTTTSPSLWLTSVTRTGQDGATAVTLPAMSFPGTPKPNLVATAATTSAGYSLITRLRLTSITNQTGGQTTIAYSAPDSSCAAGTFPSPDTNTTRCYPVYWLPPGSSSPVQDWFNLYTVSSVTATDTTGNDPPVVTSYTYAGAAWHYNDDSVSRSATTTWDQWRGYRTMTTETGTSPDPVTEQVDTYLQGKSGDRTTCTFACNTTVTVTTSRGDTVTDTDGFAGTLLESITYNGAGTGNQVTDEVHVPSGATTGTDSSGGFTSFMIENGQDRVYTTLGGGGTRESTQTFTYDSHGNVATESDVPDTANAAEDTCTTSTYTTNTTTGFVDLPATVQTLALPCGTQPSQASQLISDTQYTYDNGGTLSAGNLTKTQVAKAATLQNLFGTFTWSYTFQTEQTATFDQYGRPLTSTDANSTLTSTAYTPATGAQPASVQLTDPAGLVTTTTYDPARNLPLTVTDPAGYVDAKAYDALGRLASVWTAGNPSSGPAVQTYSYVLNGSTPSVMTEQTEQPDGGYLTRETLYDSMGQVRQTQIQAPGGADVADVTYNSDGWKALASDPYYISAPPSGTLVAAASGSVPSQTGYVYDGDGRVTKRIAYALGAETWESDSTYGGNYVTVVPPSGGVSQTTFTDGRNLTTAIYQYHAGVPASPSDPASQYDKTSYTYTPAEQLATITDAGGNTWTDTYDLLGRQLTLADPDAGTTTNTYDAAGQLLTVTDARGKQTSYTYDADGRKTAAYDTTGGAAQTPSDQLASWTWDTLAEGQLTSSTSFSGGNAYTEAVTGYNSQELPSGTQTVIPAGQGALAGTYTQQDSYAPTGDLTSYTDSAAGGLPAETVTTGFNSAGEAVSLTGASAYVDSLSYTNLGEPLQYTMGTASLPAYITDSYDPQTRRLTEQNTQTGTAQTSVDDLHYGYDNIGNVTAEANTPASGSSDVQCFQHDYLARLVQAWAQGSTGCAATPSASAEGGAAPYWNAYTYSTVGALTGITATTPAGAATSTANSFPAGGTTRPHAVTASNVTAPSGSTAASYGYDASGHLSTVTGTTQNETLTWNDAGQLSQAAITPAGGSAQNTSYVYDADGNPLLIADPGGTTLYLPDEELSLSTGTGTVTGTRYYALGDTAVATRTGASSVAYLAGDQQGTDSAAVDAASLNLTRRYYDPYGNTRGTTAPAFPAGEKGFVGGINDTATGLTDLGVREYQPGTGSFISPDPLIKPFEPTGLDPYSYAQGNPTTYSDPTGAFPCAPGDYCGPNGPKYYTGAHGCAGQSQAAVDACVKAWDNAHKKSQPRGTGGNGPVIVNSVAGSPWASIMGSMGFSAALGQLANYFRRYGQAENGQFTAIVSEVEVKTPAGSIEPRIVVIVSQKGLPPELQELFSNEHIAIVRATPREGHAEIAAREFRRNPARQLKALGGKIIRVNAAVWNNRACSDECAEAGTEYIGDPGVTIRKGGRGFIRTRLGGVEIFSVKNISKWWSRLGGRSALEVIERWNYTGGGAGREIGDIEDE